MNRREIYLTLDQVARKRKVSRDVIMRDIERGRLRARGVNFDHGAEWFSAKSDVVKYCNHPRRIQNWKNAFFCR